VVVVSLLGVKFSRLKSEDEATLESNPVKIEAIRFLLRGSVEEID